jgi:hypothetical protein
MSLNDQENTMSVDLGVSNQQQFHYHYSRAEIKVMQFGFSGSVEVTDTSLRKLRKAEF